MTSKKVFKTPIINTNQRVVSSLTYVFFVEITRMTSSHNLQQCFDNISLEKK